MCRAALLPSTLVLELKAVKKINKSHNETGEQELDKDGVTSLDDTTNTTPSRQTMRRNNVLRVGINTLFYGVFCYQAVSAIEADK